MATLLTLKREIVHPNQRKITESTLTEEQLLKHYVSEGAEVLRSLDNLGNFLMGFGVLILGYLLNSNLKIHFSNVFYIQDQLYWSSFSLFAWVAAVLILLRFMYLFVFELLAGRTIYAKNDEKNSIGERIKIKNMSYEEYEKMAPTFDDFVSKSYLETDQATPQQMWYATFRYTRYMAFKKLMIMNKMRTLLAWALMAGVIFKIVDLVLQQAL